MSTADGPRLLSLGHVTVRSTDFDRTERFYCDLLGLRPGARPPLAVPGRWFYLGDAPVLHVLPRDARAAAAPGTGTIDHFALAAADRPAFELRLRAAGVPFETRPLAGTSVRQVFLADPDGARVELWFADGN